MMVYGINSSRRLEASHHTPIALCPLPTYWPWLETERLCLASHFTTLQEQLSGYNGLLVVETDLLSKIGQLVNLFYRYRM